ncbi:uncharacterized protein LOC135205741 isoform X2 [Macrobrachium nipponense]|uniref:uncharacterized protein LOC135205741 isoform X2 n=1 Tax=Macrobrachium nipponense TaxID=159736 RepID=UPI0030C7E685
MASHFYGKVGRDFNSEEDHLFQQVSSQEHGERTEPPKKDFDSQDDPFFLQVDIPQDPPPSCCCSVAPAVAGASAERTNAEPPKKDFDSQDDPIFLEVDIPQDPPNCRVVPAFPGASAVSSALGMTSSVATSNQRSPPLRHISEESKTQKPPQNPTGSSVIATNNVHPSCHAPYSRTGVINVGVSSGKDLVPTSQPLVFYINKAASASPSSAVEGRVLPLSALNNQVITGCSVTGLSTGYQRDTSHTVTSKKLDCPANENSQRFVNIMKENGKRKYDGTPKHLQHYSRTVASNERAVLTNCTEERNYQSSKNLDGRQDRLPFSGNTPNHQSKTDASESLAHKANVLTCPDNKNGLNFLVNSKEEAKEERHCKNANQPTKRPRKGKKDQAKQLNAELVYFDLETGGLSAGVDILQIAAVSSERAFMQYVTPTKPVHPRAQDVNGLKNENGTLMKRTSVKPLTWKPLETLPMDKSLRKFLEWLEAIGPCFLVAHNATFDKKHFLYHVHMSGVHKEFKKSVLGFVNTLPFFRNTLPEFKTRGLGYRQEVLAKHLLQESYDAHDALEDVKVLQKLVQKVDVPKPDLLKHKLPF